MSKEFIHRLFEGRAQEAPDAIAVEHEMATVSYRQLNGKANRLCWLLRGLFPGKPVVGILMESGIAYIATILGVLKAGGIFMPMDAKMPALRLEFMLEDSEAAILITSPGFREQEERLGTKTPVSHLLILDEDAEALSLRQRSGDAFEDIVFPEK